VNSGAQNPPARTAPDLDAASAFRPGQREAIETIINERRLPGRPTGGGKSLIPSPATVLEGKSPLVSLMHDRRDHRARVNATFLAATLT
jgi:superfamily II DNA helicase RecQ